MLWQLAHFGLELSNPKETLQQSVLEISEPDANFDFKGTIRDPILNGPPIEQTLLNTIGHIVLEVPVARPECMDQIIEICNNDGAFEYPLRTFGRSKSPIFTFDTGDNSSKISPNPEDIYRHLLTKPNMIIHGDQFTEHNIETEPSKMMIKVLPVPSILARTAPNTHTLTDKILRILEFNNHLKHQLTDDEPFNTFIRDLVEILSYHVVTYLDNAIPGIPSDDELNAGIAQLIGTPVSLVPENDISTDIAGTTLHRIVRGINMGETVLSVSFSDYDGGYVEPNSAFFNNPENLSFELAKQIAFTKIWNKMGKKTQLIYINNFGEIHRMDIGVIQDLQWSSWDGNTEFERDDVVAPRLSPEVFVEQPSTILADTVNNVKAIDNEFTLEVPEYRSLNYLYSILEGNNTEFEQQVIVCNTRMKPVILRPFLRRLEQQNKTGSNVSLVLTGMSVDTAVKYNYTPTPDEYRNLIIALAGLHERRELEAYKRIFTELTTSKLKRISTYLKGLARSEITQILGEVVLANGDLNTDFLRNYITTFLARENRSTVHLKPNIRKPKRSLTLEEAFDNTNPEIAEPVVDEDLQEKDARNQDLAKKDDSLYNSLKGLEPLAQWAKMKGRLFTPEAREYGFVDYPRGLLLTGVPGCGKTMAAKVIAQEWGMKLHRVNPDDITSKLMGGNEENMRRLLDKLVNDAPSICFVDEAEKLFSQMNTTIRSASTNSIDSTESMLLQFMEEDKSAVFFIFTCNDLEKLSPAIIDRFDARFFVDLPDEDAREQIIRLMLEERKKGGLNIDYAGLAKKSSEFTGRDIRGSIDEAMAEAFAENRELRTEDLEKYFSKREPTSSIHAEKVEVIRKLVTEGKVRKANSSGTSKESMLRKYNDVSFG